MGRICFDEKGIKGAENKFTMGRIDCFTYLYSLVLIQIFVISNLHCYIYMFVHVKNSCEMELEIIKSKQTWAKNVLLSKASHSEKTVF